MSKEFFRIINEKAKRNEGGILYIIVNEGKKEKNIRGLKLFTCEKEKYYNKKNSEELWEKILKKLPTKIEETKIYTIENDIQIFVEKLNTTPTLIICGGGHVSLHLYKIAIMVGFEVVIIDDREEFVNKERFPKAKELYFGNFEEILKEMDYGQNSYYAIMTRGHSYDRECLKEALNKKHEYIGMIGSKRKRELLYKSLIEEGYQENELRKVHSPIGLDINAETPEEIAISIMAELINHRRKKKEESFIDDEVIKFIGESGEEVVISIILEKQGSIPRGAGAKMGIGKSGIQKGTIGGGAIEHESKLYSQKIIGENDLPQVKIYTMNNTEAKKIGMACGGNALLYIEEIKEK